MSFILNKGTKNLSKWKSASLTRSIEQPAASFLFSAPHPQKNVNLKVQDEIEILIDGEIKTKGKIYNISATSGKTEASRSYSGRSIIADVIDSSVPLQPGLFQNVSAKEIIIQLLKPYAITPNFIIQPKGITELRTNPGDTVWSSIDKLLKKENLLAFELEPAILDITRAPESGSSASLEFGTQDILSLDSYNLNISNRFSSYTVIGEGILGGSFQAKGIAEDPFITNRSLVIQLSGNVDNARCEQVAIYEATVRAARSLSFSYRVPSWFNNQGKLWTPNQRISIEDNENNIQGEHLLTSVTLNETHENEWAVLKFAPPESYTLKPPPPPE